jgi:flavodoxin
MAQCAIVYGTTEGHTARIVERIAGGLRDAGVAVDTFEASALSRFLLGAPLRPRSPVAFISVSLA